MFVVPQVRWNSSPFVGEVGRGGESRNRELGFSPTHGIRRGRAETEKPAWHRQTGLFLVPRQLREALAAADIPPTKFIEPKG